MTIYGTPMGTPLNSTGFQGTQPGNAVGATLSPLIPGVGLFPPNSNNNSGDSVAAAVSRAAVPTNADVTNFGISGSLQGGKPVLSGFSGVGTRGTGPGFVANGGSAQVSSSGGNGLGAGGQNQAGAQSGEVTTIPANGSASVLNLPATPNYRG
jgi:hypothetical protein